MSSKNRKHNRILSANLISYDCLENDVVVSQGMGKTLNVSRGGILLETHVQIDIKYSMSISIGLDDELVNIKGNAVYSKKSESGKYESGVEFMEVDKKAVRVLNKYIIAFNEQKAKSENSD
ncbi:MAG: PilZ domain-containing protein [Desulfobacterales bacterium]|jgi:c-di-GMP-binding flagellar brake protein YcgR|nr:PilZ domain-containing protein [Desulfobacteraceae bacterium]MBT4364625.1 PilZ domain-containing protein [Desulfobacteraceae bacterium]MBT7084750.1 PilZ domain-containing protein [Desulfobacterales bacterium]MBT7697908.1 PilZ domain-containing protein [Desulfobacterales bacterium]